MSEAKRAFRSQGRPVECVDEEKVWIARKTWNQSKKLADRGVKKPAEFDLQLIQYYVKKQAADQLANQPYLRSIFFDMVRV